MSGWTKRVHREWAGRFAGEERNPTERTQRLRTEPQSRESDGANPIAASGTLMAGIRRSEPNRGTQS